MALNGSLCFCHPYKWSENQPFFYLVYRVPSCTYDLGVNKQAKRMSQDVEPLGARWNPLEVGVFSLFFCFASVFGGLSFHPPQKKHEQLESPKNWWLRKWFSRFQGAFFRLHVGFWGVDLLNEKREPQMGMNFLGYLNWISRANRFRMEGFLYKQIYSPKTNTELWKSPTLKATLSSKPPWLCSMLFFGGVFNFWALLWKIFPWHGYPN